MGTVADTQAGRTFRLKVGLNTVGRLPSNDIVFEDVYVSRRHCVFLVHAWGGCDLHDTASRNGTFVNGRRVCEPVRLTSGDRLQLPGKDLLFVAEGHYRIAAEAEGCPGTVELPAAQPPDIPAAHGQQHWSEWTVEEVLAREG